MLVLFDTDWLENAKEGQSLKIFNYKVGKNGLAGSMCNTAERPRGVSKDSLKSVPLPSAALSNSETDLSSNCKS